LITQKILKFGSDTLLLEKTDTLKRHPEGLLGKKFQKRIVRSFLDIIILAITKDSSVDLHEVIMTIHEEFGVLINPATILPLLDSLEKEDLIYSKNIDGKTVCQTSLKGRQKLIELLDASNFVIGRTVKFIKEKTTTRVKKNVMPSIFKP
jgi:DNA-binding PadR family transcriptional regulator